MRRDGLIKPLREADEEVEEETTTTSQSFTDRFNAADNIEEQDAVLVEFFVSQGIEQDQAEKFVDMNPNTLFKEMDALGVSADNPFVQFIKQYYKTNGNLNPFLQANKYNAVHNSFNNLFDAKQLGFTCEESQQPRVLLNANLYSYNEVGDIYWCMQCWEYLGRYELDRQIINKYVRFLIANTTFQPNDNTSYIMNQFDDYCSRVKLDAASVFTKLRRSIMFSSELQKAVNDLQSVNETDARKRVEEYNRIKETFTSSLSSINIIRGKLADLQTISDQVKLLNINVQESDRAVSGQYQDRVGINANTREKASASTRDIRDRKTQDLVRSLHNTYGTKTNQQLINQLEDTIKLLKNNNLGSEEEIQKYNDVFSALQNMGYKDNTIKKMLADTDFSSDSVAEIVGQVLRNQGVMS